MDALDGPTVPLSFVDDETYDERGPVCIECLDTLPIGHEGGLCDDCGAEHAVEAFLETAAPEELAAF